MTSHRVSEGHNLGLRVSQRRLTEDQRSSRNQAGSQFVSAAAHGLRKSWWVTTILLLLLGAIVRFDLITREDLGPLATESEITAGDQLDQATLARQFDSYPQINYAGLDLALIDYRAIPVNNSGRPIVVADIAVRNTTGMQIRVPLSLISLITPDGDTTTPDRLEYAEHALRLVVEPGETEQALAVFKLDSPLASDVADYIIQVGETGRWPEELRFDGEVAAPLYPRPLDPVGSGDLQDGAVDPVRYGEVEIEFAEAVTSLQYGAYRAPVGQHLAVVTVSISGEPEEVQRATFDQNLWSLADEDGIRRPIRVELVDESPTGDAITQELVFYYGIDRSELSLLVGRRMQQQVAASFVAEPAE